MISSRTFKIGLVGLLCLASFEQAQAQRRMSKEQARRTIGDLLSKPSRGANIKSAEKKKVEIQASIDSGSNSSSGRRASELLSVKPPASSTFFENTSDDKVKLEQILDRQIEELFKLAKRYKDSPQRGELWLRLAELYVEKAELIDFRKQGEFDQKLRDFQDGKIRNKPVLDLSDARSLNRKSIQLYEWFIRDFPRDSKMDQALFFLGYNNYQVNDTKKGTAYYEELTRRFPKSSYVIEANFALGEFYFENERWSEAKSNYVKVLGTSSKHRLYNLALYKTAWCDYRLGNSGQALKNMERLVVINKEQSAQAELQGRKNVNKNRLENEGLRDIIIFYADAGDATSAVSYFRRLAGDEQANSFLEKLAYLYADKGNVDGARQIFSYLIEQNPTSSKAFDYKLQIVKGLSTAKRTREYRQELTDWIKNFGKSSAWFNAQNGDPDLQKSSRRLQESTLRNYTLSQHQNAQNARTPFTQNLALEGYRLYLNEFSDADLYPDMRFYFGELLYDMKEFDQASQQYRWVVENGQKSRFYARAAENIMISLEKSLPEDKEIEQRVGKTIDPVPLDKNSEEFVAGVVWYVAKFPDSEKVPEAKFRQARLYYMHNQFAQATPIFKDIISKYPKTKYAEYSTNLLLDIFNLTKDYDGLDRIGNELLQIPAIAQGKSGGEIKTVLERANFKKAQDLETAGNYKDSAVQFEAFAKQNPTSALVPAALFNAAINYERSGNIAKSLENHQAVLASDRKEASTLKPQSLRIQAKILQTTGRLEEAASAYERAAISDPKNPLAGNLYNNAAVLFEAMARLNDANRNYQNALSFVKKNERADIVFAQATNLRESKQATSSIAKYQEFLEIGSGSNDKNIEANYWIYEQSRSLGRRTQADEFKRKTLALQARVTPGKRGVGAAWAAKIKLDETLVLADQFRSIRIPVDPAAQQKAVTQKISLVNQINRELAEVIAFDSAEEIVSSLALIGQVNLSMYESLMAVPAPAGLTDSELAQYKQGVNQLSEPFLIKAKEAFRSAVSRASELDTFNEAYRESRVKLSKIDPKAIYGNEVSGNSFVQGTWMGDYK